MKRIHFKNGSHLDVTQELLEKLCISITDGHTYFQTFSYGNNMEIVINVQEIVFIARIQ